MKLNLFGLIEINSVNTCHEIYINKTQFIEFN